MLPLRSLCLVACCLALTSPSLAATAELGPDVHRRLAETNAPVKVWVFFADKGFSSPVAEQEALLLVEQSLPSRTMLRRSRRRSNPGLVDARDLPVSSAYTADVAAVAGTIHAQSRWLNAVSVDVDEGQLADLLALPFVRRVQLVGRSVGTELASGAVAPRPFSKAPGPTASNYAGASHGLAFDQLDLVEVPALHAQGYTGAGVVIGVLDTGFVTTHDAFNAPGSALDVIDAFDFVNNDSNVGIEVGDDPGQHHHGTFILGVMGANLSGTYIGAAPDASFLLAKTEDITQEVQAEEDSYVEGLEWLELNGADIVSSSLGYIDWYTQADLDGLTAVTTVAVNVATSNGVVVCTAAGNASFDNDPNTSSLIAPADALDVLTVGSVTITGEVSFFSSDGPTADGRVKPEIMGMGDLSVTVWPDDDTQYVAVSGTSLSTPQVSGALACLLQAHPEWSVQTLRERVTKTGDSLGAPAPDPLFITGYGNLLADQALQLAGLWTDLGGTLTGTTTPALSGLGALVGDEQVDLAVTGGTSGGTVWMVIGLSQVAVSFKGGTLHPSPDVIIPALPLDGSGATTLSFAWVPGVPTGASFFAQGWLPDALGPVGFAATNGVEGSAP